MLSDVPRTIRARPVGARDAPSSVPKVSGR
jgi:hypothetical protein